MQVGETSKEVLISSDIREDIESMYKKKEEIKKNIQKMKVGASTSNDIIFIDHVEKHTTPVHVLSTCCLSRTTPVQGTG